MKKIRNIIIAIILILVILGTNLSYAINSNNNEENNNFFSVSKSEASKGDNINLVFDLSKIDSEKFKIELSSSENAEEISSDEVNIEKNSDGKVIIEIDKSKLNLDKITLNYIIPENIEIGTKIEFVAKIISNIENQTVNEITQNIENETVNETDNANININEIENSSENSTSNFEENTTSENIVKEEKIIITIVEKDENEVDNKENNNTKNEEKEILENKGDNSNNQDNKTEISNEMENKENLFSNQLKESQDNNQNIQMNTNSQSSIQKETSSQGLVSNQNSTLEVTTEETYNGSSNNYLASLVIDGITLNSDFNKEKTTYFANISDLDSLNITAVSEDENATVNITGNTDLKDGTNKVLISVTAEDGSVRYYRIFVTK